MAKLIGILQISGSIDELCFSNTEDGIVVGRKPGPSPEKVLNHKDFERTRLNAREFQLAIRSATLLRSALGTAIDGVRATKLSGRMNGLLYSVADQDEQHGLGCRCAAAGDVSRLKGFEFNHKLSLGYALPVPFEQHLDAASGTAQVNIPSFIARRRKGFPKEATHFKIVSCVATVDFDQDSNSRHIVESELLPLSKLMPAVELRHQLAGKPGEAMVHTLGMVFYTVADGKTQLLRGGAMQVVEAVRVAEVEVPEIDVQETSTDNNEAASYEADDFVLGITDAMGLPLQDKEMQQVVITAFKEPRKRSRLKGYLGRRLE
jgi:hypothetical protein